MIFLSWVWHRTYIHWTRSEGNTFTFMWILSQYFFNNWALPIAIYSFIELKRSGHSMMIKKSRSVKSVNVPVENSQAIWLRPAGDAWPSQLSCPCCTLPFLRKSRLKILRSPLFLSLSFNPNHTIYDWSCRRGASEDDRQRGLPHLELKSFTLLI